MENYREYKGRNWKAYHRELTSDIDRELHIKYTYVKGYSLGRLLREIETDIDLASSKVMKYYLKRRKSELRREYDIYLKNQKILNYIKEQESKNYEVFYDDSYEEVEDNYSEGSMP
ncbi:MAG: hypothetical protein ACK5LC_00990 [Coprobacillaceae bacterium]